MDGSFKYPRTYHLPWSKGTSSDDRLFTEAEMIYFHDKEIVVTEKLDGENTSMYRDHYHARSMDSRPHPSQNWARSLHAILRHSIQGDWRICGENLYAKHSIYYDRLESFFYIFSIWNSDNVALSWDDTLEYVDYLNLELEGSGLAVKSVPTLYRGPWDELAIRSCWTEKSQFGEEQEGYVVRNTASFPFPFPQETSKHEMPVFRDLSKYVRPKHVRTDSHWRKTWTPNKLRESVCLS